MVKREFIVLCGFLHFGPSGFGVAQIKEKEQIFPPLFLFLYLLLIPFLYPHNLLLSPTFKSIILFAKHAYFL